MKLKKKNLIITALIFAIVGFACATAASIFNFIQNEWKLGIIMVLVACMDILLIIMNSLDLRWELEAERYEKEG